MEPVAVAPLSPLERLPACVLHCICAFLPDPALTLLAAAGGPHIRTNLRDSGAWGAALCRLASFHRAVVAGRVAELAPGVTVISSGSGCSHSVAFSMTPRAAEAAYYALSRVTEVGEALRYASEVSLLNRLGVIAAIDDGDIVLASPPTHVVAHGEGINHNILLSSPLQASMPTQVASAVLVSRRRSSVAANDSRLSLTLSPGLAALSLSAAERSVVDRLSGLYDDAANHDVAYGRVLQRPHARSIASAAGSQSSRGVEQSRRSRQHRFQNSCNARRSSEEISSPSAVALTGKQRSIVPAVRSRFGDSRSNSSTFETSCSDSSGSSANSSSSGEDEDGSPLLRLSLQPRTPPSSRGANRQQRSISEVTAAVPSYAANEAERMHRALHRLLVQAAVDSRDRRLSGLSDHQPATASTVLALLSDAFSGCLTLPAPPPMKSLIAAEELAAIVNSPDEATHCTAFTSLSYREQSSMRVPASCLRLATSGLDFQRWSPSSRHRRRVHSKNESAEVVAALAASGLRGIGVSTASGVVRGGVIPAAASGFTSQVAATAVCNGLVASVDCGAAFRLHTIDGNRVAMGRFAGQRIGHCCHVCSLAVDSASGIAAAGFADGSAQLLNTPERQDALTMQSSMRISGSPETEHNSRRGAAQECHTMLTFMGGSGLQFLVGRCPRGAVSLLPRDLVLYDAHTGAIVRQLDDTSSGSTQYTTTSLAATGSHVAAVGYSCGKVVLWDMRSTRRAAVLTPMEDPVRTWVSSAWLRHQAANPTDLPSQPPRTDKSRFAGDTLFSASSEADHTLDRFCAVTHVSGNDTCVVEARRYPLTRPLMVGRDDFGLEGGGFLQSSPSSPFVRMWDIRKASLSSPVHVIDLGAATVRIAGLHVDSSAIFVAANFSRADRQVRQAVELPFHWNRAARRADRQRQAELTREVAVARGRAAARSSRPYGTALYDDFMVGDIDPEAIPEYAWPAGHGPLWLQADGASEASVVGSSSHAASPSVEAACFKHHRRATSAADGSPPQCSWSIVERGRAYTRAHEEPEAPSARVAPDALVANDAPAAIVSMSGLSVWHPTAGSLAAFVPTTRISCFAAKNGVVSIGGERGLTVWRVDKLSS